MKVRRVIEYEGSYEKVTDTLRRSIHGEYRIGDNLTIREISVDHDATCMCVECLPHPKEPTDATSQSSKSSVEADDVIEAQGGG